MTHTCQGAIFLGAPQAIAERECPACETMTVAVMTAGDVEYDRAAAAVNIEELIWALEFLRREGATHVVGLSGNYRGAQYVRLGVPEFEYEDES